MPTLDYETHEEQFEQAMEEIRRDVDALCLENQLFERYLNVREKTNCFLLNPDPPS